MIYPHNTDITISFYNNKIKEVISADLISEPFTYVPIKAGYMELVCGNAIVFGKITEGKDLISCDVSVTKEYTDISSDVTKIDLQVERVIVSSADVKFDSGNGSYTSFSCVYIISFPLTVKEDIPYYIHASGVFDSYSGWNPLETIDNTTMYLSHEGDDAINVKNGLDLAIKTVFGESKVTTGPSSVKCYIFPFQKNIYWQGRIKPVIKIDDVFTLKIEAYLEDLGMVTKFPILKKGSSHEFGIVYKDNCGRQCAVIKSDDLSVYIPFYIEDALSLPENFSKITFKLNHIPPTWATSYEIVYGGNFTMSSFLQIRIAEITYLGDHRYSLMIQDTLDWSRTKSSRWKVPDWIWMSGDRIRLISTISISGIVTLLDKYYDYEITQTGTQYGDVIGGDWLIIQTESVPSSFPVYTNGEITDPYDNNIIAEIYRPRIGLESIIYYGVGMVFEIGTDQNGNKYHKGTVDQIIDSSGISTLPAEVINMANDSWLFARLNYLYQTATILPFWAESISPSDWWANQNKLSFGFPFLYDISQHQKDLDERIRHGGYLVVGTEVNNIAHFTYDDFMDLPKKNGDITGLREIGYTLKVLQLHKETSIYIQRIQTFNPDGTEQFTLIDKLLGTARPMEEEYGCQHPDSVLVEGRNLYYWDNTEGKFIRSSPNGQVPISDLKMQRWFKTVSTWIKTNGGPSLLAVNTGSNVDHSEIWLSFKIGEQVMGAIFSESRNRWITRIDQVTEGYLNLGSFFAHMYKQKLYIMNVDEGQDYLHWATGPTHGEIEFVSNAEIQKNKVYNSIAVYSNFELSCPSRSIKIPIDGSAGSSLMESYIARWTNTEGIYYGAILKDQNSKGVFSSENDRTMNGRDMRGRYCIFRFRTDEHANKVKLHSVIIISTPSERSE
jgi:hypothetical protein